MNERYVHQEWFKHVVIEQFVNLVPWHLVMRIGTSLVWIPESTRTVWSSRLFRSIVFISCVYHQISLITNAFGRALGILIPADFSLKGMRVKFFG